MRFCPQCGDRVSFARSAGKGLRTQKDRKVDAEGFCVVKTASVTSGPRAGCTEHLRRFDAETGARLGESNASLPRTVDPWIITST